MASNDIWHGNGWSNKSISGKTWGGRDEDIMDGDGDHEDGQG